MSVEYFNLSNGIACLDHIGRALADDPEEPRYSRIQSTWCEQKLWNQLLLTTPPDMYFHLANRESVIVHDKSEKDRLTRAQWQGLGMIRVACNLAWWGITGPQYSRSGMNVTEYFIDQWVELPPTTQRYIEWFGKYAPMIPTFWVDLVPCTCWIPVDKQPIVEV